MFLRDPLGYSENTAMPIGLGDPRIFIDPSGYDGLNLGDGIMLEVAIQRLRALWPRASLVVQCLDPEPFIALDASIEPLDAHGSLAWCAEVSLLGRPARLGTAARRHWPRAAAAAARAALWLKRRDTRCVTNYLDAVRRSDLVLLSGGGHLNDEFRRHAHVVLETLDLAMRSGATTVLLAQGIGPLTDARLRAHAAEILPRVDFISLRETVKGLPLLRAFGVAENRIATTGDDAIVHAYRARASALGSAIGVNLRLASYAGVGDEVLQIVGAVVRECSAKRGAELIPVPISLPGDLAAAQRMLKFKGGTFCVTGTETLLNLVRRCRVVVTGSYHAAVLALSMGIPAVTIAASAYYRDKFRGLAHQFGAGCCVIETAGAAFHRDLSAAIDHAWNDAELTRPGLLIAAARQIDLAQAAYRHVFQVLETRRRIQPNRR
jgi:polysaccharide pyruvyl transferase WcaK-like protein